MESTIREEMEPDEKEILDDNEMPLTNELIHLKRIWTLSH